jgi:hypothetical protein
MLAGVGIPQIKQAIRQFQPLSQRRILRLKLCDTRF